MARILLADDDKGSRDLVRRALELDGHAVVDGEDGIEAQSLLRSDRFDLLVTDVQMPGLDGISLAKEAIARDAAIRVAVMSGYTDKLDAVLLARGARLLVKPLAIERIRSEVRAALA